MFKVNFQFKYSGVIFSAVSYKSLDAFSNSICSLIQPTSHPKRFLDKLDTLIEYMIN